MRCCIRAKEALYANGFETAIKYVMEAEALAANESEACLHSDQVLRDMLAFLDEVHASLELCRGLSGEYRQTVADCIKEELTKITTAIPNILLEESKYKEPDPPDDLDKHYRAIQNRTIIS